MSKAPSPRPTSRLLSSALSVPLRFKITIPYLIIAILLAGVAAWLVSQSFARALQERFRSQLVDSATAANESLFKLEASQLSGVRAIAATNGVAEAVEAHDWEAIDRAIRPIVVNEHLGLVHILDNKGQPVYGLRALPDGYAQNENADFANWLPVAKVLKQETDPLGDKFVGVVDAPWGLALYTVAPIKEGDRLIGAVLVGTPLAEVLGAMQNGTGVTVTVYRPDGQAALSSAGGATTPPALAASLVQQLTQGDASHLQSRTMALGDEALGTLYLRGQASGWFVGTAWPRSAVAAQLSAAELIGWFSLGIVVVIGLGLLVAQLVAAPVSELLAASLKVADGDFDVAVKEHGRDELGELAQRFNWMVQELKQREMMREVFGQMVSEEVREALLTGKVEMGGEMKMVTVLFTDIRDFTSLAESYDPQEVVTLLNDYFEVVSDCIQKAGGFINKFGGDSTLAVFGAPLAAEPSDTAHRALQAAFAIRTHLAEFNARQIERERPPIRIGIGINTGEAVTGNIGSRSRFEYTVIGDTVNTAARVQSLTNRFNDSNILITEDTRQALGKDAQLLVIDHGDVALKGKMKLVRVYGVMGMRFTDAEPVFHVGGIPRRDVLEALYLYCRGFSPRTIGQTKNIDPMMVHQWVDGAARLYLRASEELRQEFGLTDTELKRLEANARRLAQAEPEPETIGEVSATGVAPTNGTTPSNGTAPTKPTVPSNPTGVTQVTPPNGKTPTNGTAPLNGNGTAPLNGKTPTNGSAPLNGKSAGHNGTAPLNGKTPPTEKGVNETQGPKTGKLG
jgi:class 3 adenylate cyclase